MSDNFVIWKYQEQPYAAVLETLSGFEKEFRLKDGVPLQATFPEDVQYHMHADFPNDIGLVDNMQNLHRLAVTSTRLKEAIEQRSAPHMEFLPIAIIDHKKRVASKDYFIVHPVGLVDCIDREQSVYRNDVIIPGNLAAVKKLVLDEARIPPDREIFRLEGFREVLIVRRDVAAALDEGKFTGLAWQRVQDYPRK
jgi:hypothetical protein